MYLYIAPIHDWQNLLTSDYNKQNVCRANLHTDFIDKKIKNETSLFILLINKYQIKSDPSLIIYHHIETSSYSP